jgi:hypothetical protein
MKLLNFNLIKHWENWATILLMVSIAFFAVNSIGKLVEKERQ